MADADEEMAGYVEQEEQTSHNPANLETIQNYVASLLNSTPEGNDYFGIKSHLGQLPVHKLVSNEISGSGIQRLHVILAPEDYSPPGGYDAESEVGFATARSSHDYPIIETTLAEGEVKSISFFWGAQEKTFKGSFRDPIYDNLPPTVKALMEKGSTDTNGGVTFELGGLPTGGDIERATFYGSAPKRPSSRDEIPKGTHKESAKFDSKRGEARMPWHFITRNESSEFVAELLKLLPVKPVDLLITEHDQQAA